MSREVANLTWRKNPYPPIYGVKEFVCLFVTNFDFIYRYASGPPPENIESITYIDRVGKVRKC